MPLKTLEEKRCVRCHNVRDDIPEGIKTCQRCLDDKNRYQRTPIGKAKQHAAKNAWRKTANGKRYMRAHGAVANALKRGRLIKQPCRDCNSDDVQAHHPDYDRRLDIIWLCRLHHKEEHRAVGHQTS